MKLKTFIENLTKFVTEHPEALDLDVVTSRDDEGNGYNLVHYTPEVGNYNAEDKEFSAAKELNAVCIN